MSLELLSPIYKDEIGKGFSYPIGAELLSERLFNVPQYHDTSVSFRNGEGYLMGGYSAENGLMTWKGDIGGLLPVNDIIAASFSSRTGSWSIIIRRITSDRKHIAKQFLLNTGLPIVKAWLEAKRPETWYNGYRTLEIGLVKETNFYAYLETQQVSTRQIVDKYIAVIPENTLASRSGDLSGNDKAKQKKPPLTKGGFILYS